MNSSMLKVDVPPGKFDRRESNIKWFVLIMCALSSLGDYYCIDNVGVLHDYLRDHFKDSLGPIAANSTTNSNDRFEYYFGLLYSLYSFPNIILPLIGGILVITLGNRIMYIVVGIFLFGGQFLFSLGCAEKNMTLMLIGRTIFGVGGETINICQNCMLVKWFKKEELSFPFAITITVSRLGSVLNDIASPQIASKGTPAYALWTGLAVVIFSFICSIVLISTDKYIDNNEANNNSELVTEGEKVDFNSFSELKYAFWLLAIICLTLYGGFLPFNNIASAYLTSTYFKGKSDHDARNAAGLYMAVPFFIGIFCVPFFGYIIDKIGKRSYLALISAISGFLVFLMFYVFPPLVPLITLGITYSLFASVIWPSIAIICKREHAGLAFGISTSIQNAGLATFPVIVAAILTETKNNYNVAMLFFLLMMGISIIMCILLIIEDKRLGGILNKINFDDELDKQNKDEYKQIEGDEKISDNILMGEENSKERLTGSTINIGSTLSSIQKSKDEESSPVLSEKEIAI